MILSGVVHETGFPVPLSSSPDVIFSKRILALHSRDHMTLCSVLFPKHSASFNYHVLTYTGSLSPNPSKYELLDHR